MDAVTVSAAAGEARLGGVRLAAGYAVLLAVVAAAAAVAFSAGRGEHAAPEVAGSWTGGGACLGDRFDLSQAGTFVDLHGVGGAGGKLRLRHGRLTGALTCAGGGAAHADLAVHGHSLAGTVAGSHVSARFAAAPPAPGASAKPAPKRSSEETFGRLMLAIAAVILAARFVGAAIARLGQPQVMGEVLAGILLGPSLLGAIAPSAKDYLFPADIVPLVSGAAQIGLAFYLFLVGMEIDPRLVRERARQAAFISNASVAFPMALGLLVALPLYRILAPPKHFAPFALFVGVAMSITAFPVLARILTERRMLQRPVGAVSMAGAAVDDVTAWSLLALATAVAGKGSGLHALQVVGLAALFTAAMIVVGRPLLGRVSAAYDEAGSVPPIWIGIIFVGVLLAAFVAQTIGIAAIFGAFLMGAIMPRHGGLTDDVSRRLEDFVVTVLLPLFFVVTGLRTHVGALNRPVLWLVTLGLVGVAIAGKWIGAMLAARYGGFSLRDSAVIGALMNTRGLTELIVLNIGLDLGLLPTTLFTMLVVMALVTTFMAGPALRLLDPQGRLAVGAGEELQAAARELRPLATLLERSIIVAPQDDSNLDALLALGEPLAQSQPPRELMLVRLLQPARLAPGLASENRELRRATEELARRRELLAGRGIDARAVAFTTPDAGADLVRLASDTRIDLLLLDGRRPLVGGGGVPRGEVGEVLREAPCDVAVLVERAGVPEIDETHPVVVPFGGAEHDWAALELGAWIANARRAPLQLLGAAASEETGGRDASRLLASASLVVQQLAGVAAEPVLARPGREVIDRAAGAGLLVVGLSERWREEGLGELRAEIVRAAPAATLLVRRGSRPGALAPRDDATRFRWSSASGGMGRR